MVGICKYCSKDLYSKDSFVVYADRLKAHHLCDKDYFEQKEKEYAEKNNKQNI